MTNHEDTLKNYLVRVGHWELSLKARNAEEAIEIARRKMACELPRLYDVIRSLTANRFQVETAA